MPAVLNHTIVWCRDKVASAKYLTAILGLPDSVRFGPFEVVELSNGVSMDFHDRDEEIALGGSRNALGWGDQYPLRRAWCVLLRSRRSPPRDHHEALREPPAIAGGSVAAMS